MCISILRLAPTCRFLQHLFVVLFFCTKICSTQTITTLYTQIEKQYARPPHSLTEGLVYHPDEDVFFESGVDMTGYASWKPWIRKLSKDFEMKNQKYSSGVYATGITISNNFVYQSTWMDYILMKWDSLLTPIGQSPYPHTAYGITTDDQGNFIISDGTPTLRLTTPTEVNPSELHVKLNNSELCGLDELELVQSEGLLYATLWTPVSCTLPPPLSSMHLVAINYATGVVEKIIDCRPLCIPESKEYGVSAVAYKGGHFFITGKKWTSIYEVTLSTTQPKPSTVPCDFMETPTTSTQTTDTETTASSTETTEATTPQTETTEATTSPTKTTDATTSSTSSTTETTSSSTTSSTSTTTSSNSSTSTTSTTEQTTSSASDTSDTTSDSNSNADKSKQYPYSSMVVMFSLVILAKLILIFWILKGGRNDNSNIVTLSDPIPE